ncbi:MAG: hypothetical protein AAGP08_09575 [Pseudomonadota bacterium]
MDQSRRIFFLTGAAGAAVGATALGVDARPRPRWLSLFIESVIVGAISGYVAGRMARDDTFPYEIDANWHRSDLVIAPRQFLALEYPTDDDVRVPAGSYEVFGQEQRVEPVAGQPDLRLTCLILKNHHTKHLVGVIYT